MPASRRLMSPRRLLPAVLRQFLSGGRSLVGLSHLAPLNPLVLVDPTGAAAPPLLRDVHDLWTSRDTTVAAWCPGRDLGRELAAAAEAGAAHPLERRLDERLEHRGNQALELLVVPEVDRLGPAAAQRPFARLLEMAIRSGVLCCVSLASLTANPLEPRLSSRLAAGLVLPLSQPARRSATEVLATALRTPPQRPPSVRRVIATVARQHGLEPHDLVGPSRRRGVSEPRAIAMFVLRVVSGRSLHAIGRSFGGRDHTTVMHAIRLVGDRIVGDPATAREVERLIAAVTTPHTGRRCRIDVG